MKKHIECHRNQHGCRLSSDGLVCQNSCEWLDRYPEEKSVTENEWESAKRTYKALMNSMKEGA